jgi:hypothetical protein
MSWRATMITAASVAAALLFGVGHASAATYTFTTT